MHTHQHHRERKAAERERERMSQLSISNNKQVTLARGCPSIRTKRQIEREGVIQTYRHHIHEMIGCTSFIYTCTQNNWSCKGRGSRGAISLSLSGTLKLSPVLATRWIICAPMMCTYIHFVSRDQSGLTNELKQLSFKGNHGGGVYICSPRSLIHKAELCRRCGCVCIHRGINNV